MGLFKGDNSGGGSGLKNNLAATVAPTAGDDSGSGYAVGSRWIDVTADKEYVCLDATATAAVWTETTAGAAGGETNTASNVGTAGVGVFKQKTGVALELKKINAGSNKITVTDDVANSELDIDVAEANVVHDNLSGAGANSHAQVDTHLADVANPHAVTAAQAGASPSTHNHNATYAAIAHESNVTNPHAVTKAQVGLTNVADLKVNLVATVAPTAGDDSGLGYAVGSRWIDVTADKEYVCLDSTVGAAVWIETTQSGGSSLVAFSAHRNGVAQAGFAQAIWTKVRFTTEVYDIGGYFAHDAADTDAGGALSRFTPLVAGKYIITFQSYFNGMADGNLIQVNIKKNGAFFATGMRRLGNSGGASSAVSIDIDMNGATDYLEFFAYQDNPTSQSIHGAQSITFVMGHLIG